MPLIYAPVRVPGASPKREGLVPSKKRYEKALRKTIRYISPMALFPPFFLAALTLMQPVQAQAPTTRGYFRTPSLRGDTVVFAAEGDLWRVSVSGGLATRLTTHPSDESDPAISPDGKWVAFSAAYEGSGEVSIMPLNGGEPTRLTFGAGGTVGSSPPLRPRRSLSRRTSRARAAARWSGKRRSIFSRTVTG